MKNCVNFNVSAFLFECQQLTTAKPIGKLHWMRFCINFSNFYCTKLSGQFENSYASFRNNNSLWRLFIMVVVTKSKIHRAHNVRNDIFLSHFNEKQILTLLFVAISLCEALQMKRAVFCVQVENVHAQNNV